MQIQRINSGHVIVVLLFVFAGVIPASSQVWLSTYGGADTDVLFSVIPRLDGSITAIGDTYSSGEGDRDVWLLHVDRWGTLVDQTTYGSSFSDGSVALKSTQDGGFIAAGWRSSSTGSGKTVTWLIKYNALNVVEWQQEYGTTDCASLKPVAIRQTMDGGFCIVASCSNDTLSDYLVVKLDSIGLLLWQYSLGTALDDRPVDLVETADFGFVVTGYSYDTVTGYDIWTLKLDTIGNPVWQKAYRAALDDRPAAIRQTSDGGFLVGGRTESFGAGLFDVFLLKLDSTGAITWQKTYGDILDESAVAFVETHDAGFLVGGQTTSSGFGWSDMWLLRVDQAGTILWQSALGSTGIDTLSSVSLYNENEFLVSGFVDSTQSVDVDAWLVKLDMNGSALADCEYLTASSAVSGSASFSAEDTAVTPSAVTMVTGIYTVKSDTGVPTGETLCSACLNDTYEQDDSCSLAFASQIHSSERQIHDFCDDDSDWLVFNAREGQTYTLETRQLGLDADTVIELVDSDCATVLLEDDDSGNEARSSKIQWTAPVNRSYMLRVKQADGYVGNFAATGNFSYYHLALEGDTSPWTYWARSFNNGAAKSVEDSVQRASGSKGGMGTAVLQARDGSLIVASRRSGAFHVMKLDQEGLISWQQVLGGGNLDELSGMIQSADGNLVLYGLTTSFGGADDDPWIVKMDYSGTILWQFVYDTVPDTTVYDMVSLPDGSLCAVGSSDGDGWFMKLDPSGTHIWSWTYGGSGSDILRACSGARSGGFILVGETSSFGAGGTDIWVVAVDAAGSVIWQKTFGETADDKAYDVISRFTQGVLITGTTTSFGTGVPAVSHGFILALDPVGNVIWQQVYDSPLSSEGFSLATAKGNNYLLSGQVQTGGGDDDFFLLSLDQTGSILWGYRYGTSQDDTSPHVTALTDGGSALAGPSLTGPDGILVLKLDETGQLDAGCSAFSAAGLVEMDTLFALDFTTASTVKPAVSASVTVVSPIPESSSETDICFQKLPEEVSPVAASQPLLFTDKTTMIWEEGSFSGADTFNLYSGTLADLVSGSCGSCAESSIPGNTTQFSADPSPGECFFFLVTGENPAGEGPMGFNSSGQVRTNGEPC